MVEKQRKRGYLICFSFFLFREVSNNNEEFTANIGPRSSFFMRNFSHVSDAQIPYSTVTSFLAPLLRT